MADTGVLEGATATGNTGAGDQSWSNPTQALTSNDARARAVGTANSTETTQELTVTNFSAGIDASATIDGIEVFIERQRQSNDSVEDLVVSLTGITGATDNNADTVTNWPTSDAEVTYGGSTDKWGAGSISVSEVNSTSFGAILRATLTSSKFTSVEALVDRIAVKVYYTAAAAGLTERGTGRGVLRGVGRGI